MNRAQKAREILTAFFGKDIFSPGDAPLGITEQMMQKIIDKQAFSAALRGPMMLTLATTKLISLMEAVGKKHGLQNTLDKNEIAPMYNLSGLFFLALGKGYSLHALNDVDKLVLNSGAPELSRVSGVLMEKHFAFCQEMALKGKDEGWEALQKHIPTISEAYQKASEEYSAVVKAAWEKSRG